MIGPSAGECDDQKRRTANTPITTTTKITKVTKNLGFHPVFVDFVVFVIFVPAPLGRSVFFIAKSAS